MEFSANATSDGDDDLYTPERPETKSDDYYRRESERAINEAIEQSRGKSPEEIRFAIRRSYPFGDGARRGRPYKIWNGLVLKKEKEFGLPQQKRSKRGPAGE